MLQVDAGRCTGCGLCTKVCPFGALTVAAEIAVVGDTCTMCGACTNSCPEKALILQRPLATAADLAAYRGVMVWGEGEGGGDYRPKKVVLELLGQGRRLADKLGEELAVVVAAEKVPETLDIFFAHGADLVVCCPHPLLGEYHTDAFTTVLAAIIAAKKPSIFLLGATPAGRDLAPRLAARLRLGLTADCTDLDIDDQGQLVQTRPAFGGNIMASILTPYTRPQMATVRPNVFQVQDGDCQRRGRLERFEVQLSRAALRTRVVAEEVVAADTREGLETAKVIVAAGRGCQRPENLELVRQLASELGGVVAASRAVVELGWLPHTVQVGQSGTTVSPDLYVAVGISGAIQHLVGMSSAKKVVAINTDAEAPIFKVADFGIVGDAMQVLPRLIAHLRRAKAGGRSCGEALALE